MPFPRGPRFPPFPGVSPPPSAKVRPVLGVGWRVIVTCGGGGDDRVTLTDATGESALATVADGVEVEILAWRPCRGGDSRYRVVSTSGVEGWLGGASLQPRPLSQSPQVGAVVAPSVGLKSPRRTPRGEAQRTPRSPTGANGVPMKTVDPTAKSTRKRTR